MDQRLSLSYRRKFAPTDLICSNRSRSKFTPIFPEVYLLRPFFIKYASNMTCADLGELAIPQCISPQQAGMSAKGQSTYFKAGPSKYELHKFTTVLRGVFTTNVCSLSMTEQDRRCSEDAQQRPADVSRSQPPQGHRRPGGPCPQYLVHGLKRLSLRLEERLRTSPRPTMATDCCCNWDQIFHHSWDRGPSLGG